MARIVQKPSDPAIEALAQVIGGGRLRAEEVARQLRLLGYIIRPVVSGFDR